MKQKTTTKQVNIFLLKIFLLVFVVFTFFIITQSTTVHALGAAPSSYNIDYEEGAVKDLNVRVLNSDGKPRKILLRVQGDYASSVELSQYYVDFASGETEKTVTYTLTHPENLPSGNHEIDVVLIELPDELTGNSIITVSNTVVQKINLFSAYDGAFISGTLYVNEADVAQPITFTVRATNKGTQTTLVSGDVIIKGPLNNEITRVSLTPKELTVGSNAQLTAVLSGLPNAGFYVAEAVLFYENKNIQLTKNFQIGSLNIEPINLEVGSFTLGEIVRVRIEAQNDWNQDVEGVYAVVDVLDQLGRTATSFQTVGVPIFARQRATLEGFWDTSGLDIGTYDLVVNLHYAGKTSEKIFSSVVGIDSLQVLNNQLSGQVTGQSSDDGGSYTLLIILILVVIVMNAVVIIYFKRRGGKDK